MPDQDDINRQIKILEAWRGRLGHQLRQQGRIGPTTPYEVLDEIQEARAEIRRIKSALRARGVNVEDALVDDPQAPIEADPRLAKLYYAQGTALVDDPKRLDEAIAAFNQATAYAPDDGVILYDLGRAYGLKNDFPRALAVYNKAIEILSRSGHDSKTLARAYNNRGTIYRSVDDRDQAIADFTEAIVYRPRYGRALLNRAWTYYDQGELDLVIADTTIIIDDDPNNAADAYYLRGRAFQDRNDASSARADFAKAIALSSDTALRAQAEKRLRDLGPEPAPSQRDPRRAKLFYKTGLERARKGEFARAIEAFSQAIVYDPDDAGIYVELGYVYGEQGEYTHAMENYDRAIELDPKNAVAYNNRGAVYDKMGEYEDAIAEYNQAIAISPETSLFFCNRGIAYFRINEFDKAEADPTRAIEIDRYPDAYYWRARVYKSQVKKDDTMKEKAIRDFKIARERITDEELLARIRNRLEELGES